MSAVLEPRVLGQSRPSTAVATHAFWWSVRRELWENRFIFVAPAAVALLVVFAYVVGSVHLPEILGSNPRMIQSTNTPPSGLPFSIGTLAVVLAGILSGVFYSLNALYAERRDRSILFWKSLPLSDRIVVLAKAAIPLAVLPAFTLLVTLAMQLAMLGLGALVTLAAGASFPAFWTGWPFLQMAVVMLYCFVTLMLWHAPLYAWLFMVSAWAKRAPFLWAVLTPLALGVAEKVAFNTSLLCSMIFNRVAGGFNAAFNYSGTYSGPIPLDAIAPGKFFSNPDLWVGLLFAAGFFAAAIRLRRFHGPI